MNDYNTTCPRKIFLFKQEHLEGKINLSPEFQRNSVWTPIQKSYLIDTIMKGLPIPTIYVWHHDGKQSVIDGQQRLQAILDFFDNKIALPDNFFQKDLKLGHVLLNGKYWSDIEKLSKTVGEIATIKNKFSRYLLPIVDLDDADMNLIIDIFDRLNSGQPLNKIERINAKYYEELFYKSALELGNNEIMQKYIKLCSEFNNERMLDRLFFLNVFISFYENKLINGSENTIEQKIEQYTAATSNSALIAQTIKRTLDSLNFLNELDLDLKRLNLNHPNYLYTLIMYSGYCLGHNYKGIRQLKTKVNEYFEKGMHVSGGNRGGGNQLYVRKERLNSLLRYTLGISHLSNKENYPLFDN